MVFELRNFKCAGGVCMCYLYVHVVSGDIGMCCHGAIFYPARVLLLQAGHCNLLLQAQRQVLLRVDG
jgi:hypothetical protein